VAVGSVPVAVKVDVGVAVGVGGGWVGVLVGVTVQATVAVGVGGVVMRKTWMALTWDVSVVEVKTMSNWPVVTTTVVGTS
jgi:hypothetical protein